MEKFDYQNFDYEQASEDLKKEIKKPNILLCGATGVGKSSLVNDIFDFSESDDISAKIGNSGRPETRGVKKFTNDDSTINLYDSEGYEIGKVDQDMSDRYFKEIISFIDKAKNEYPSQMEKHIHEVWYCVSAGNKRFYEVDKKIIEAVKEKKVPVMILLTKVDDVSDDELKQLIAEIHKSVSDVEVFTYSTEISEEDEEIYKQYVQKSEIITWAIENLEESLKLGLLPAVKGCLKEKREAILKVCVTKYTAIAAATVVASSFVPVPFSDSVPLMGIQIKMAMSIINSFNINANVKNIVSDLLGTTMVSFVGKTLASQIVSWIPAVGTVVKAVVNTTVAASITAGLGAGITLIAERYLVACVNNNGAENLPFTEYLTKERFDDAMSYVKDHKSEFGLDNIITKATKK